MFGFNIGRDSNHLADAKAKVAAGATLLDVRTRDEFASGHVKGAVNIPVQELGQRLREVPRGAVVVYCRSGGRSASAASILSANGYDVTDVGPMPNW